MLLGATAPRGLEWVVALAAGERPWEGAFGKLALGYVSVVDGSTQPYGLIVPHGHDAGHPAWLDVVLHGSQKTLGLSELRHVAKFDAGDGGVAPCSTPQLFASIEPSARATQPVRRGLTLGPRCKFSSAEIYPTPGLPWFGCAR